jgi:beta-lactamase class D
VAALSSAAPPDLPFFGMRCLSLALSLFLLIGCVERTPVAPTVVATTAVTPPCDAAADIAGAAFEGRAAAFVWLDPAAGVALCHGRATERRVPASTFKIPHALIALDAGVLDGPEAAMTWNSEAYPAEGWWPPEWARDHTLASALHHSVVWYYREVARMVGPEREQRYLAALDLGNAEVGDNPTSFWLVGPLAISAEEQVVFLQRLWEGSLPVGTEVQEQTREMVSVLREADGERVLGKTGTGRMDNGSLNWLVGVVERPQGPAFFAFWIEAEGWIPPDRRLAVLEALRTEAPETP